MLQVIQNYKTGQVELEEVPAPAPHAGRVLVRTLASVVSVGTERHLMEMGKKTLLGKAIARPDLVRRVFDKVKTDGVAEAFQQVKQRLDSAVPLGYSAAGRVEFVGSGITGFKAGDLVAVGGEGTAVHAEILSAPKTLVVPVPGGLSTEAAAFAMIGAIPLHAIRLARQQPGEWIAVIGLGLLGLLAVQILKAVGCRVIGLDVDQIKLELARKPGADEVADCSEPDISSFCQTVTSGHGLDAALITASAHNNLPLEVAAKLARVRGRIVAVGLVGLTVPRHIFFEKELELIVSRASHNRWIRYPSFSACTGMRSDKRRDPAHRDFIPQIGLNIVR